MRYDRSSLPRVGAAGPVHKLGHQLAPRGVFVLHQVRAHLLDKLCSRFRVGRLSWDNARQRELGAIERPALEVAVDRQTLHQAINRRRGPADQRANSSVAGVGQVPQEGKGLVTQRPPGICGRALVRVLFPHCLNLVEDQQQVLPALRGGGARTKQKHVLGVQLLHVLVSHAKNLANLF